MFDPVGKLFFYNNSVFGKYFKVYFADLAVTTAKRTVAQINFSCADSEKTNSTNFSGSISKRYSVDLVLCPKKGIF